MGRGTRVRIENQSETNLEISYEDVCCMFRGGDEGLNFDPISGQINPQGCLPRYQEDQYLEKEANGLCAFKDGYFTMKLTEVSSGKHLARIKFKADKYGYKCEQYDLMDDRLNVVLDMGSNKLKVLISSSPKFERVAGYPYIDIEFNSDGKLIDPRVTDTVIEELKHQNQITDLLFLVHGVNNTKKAAKEIYEKYLQIMRECQDEQQRIAVCGVIWASQIVSDEEEWYESIVNFTGNLTKITPARNLGEKGLAPFLNTVATKHNQIHIHLAAHSMGTVVVRGALRELSASIKTVFFIQSPLSANKSLPLVPSNVLDSKLEESYINKWVCGPIICTYSGKDDLLKKIPFFTTMGEKGFLELSGNHKVLPLRSGTKVSHQDFDKRFVNLDCGEAIGDHNDFKKVEIAQSHLAAIEKSKQIRDQC